MLRKITEQEYQLFADDPVRPHISAEFRTTENRTAFVLGDNPRAVICASMCAGVPTCEEDLDTPGDVAVFYTVWSYDRGAGRQIVFDAIDWAKQNTDAQRFVTLSPKTEMARKFHLSNGAIELQENQDTINYEYIQE